MVGHLFSGPKCLSLHFYCTQHLGPLNSEIYEAKPCLLFYQVTLSKYNTRNGLREEQMFKSLSPALAAQSVKAQPLKNHTVQMQQKSEKAKGWGVDK